MSHLTNLAGRFVGTCTNTTSDITANLRLQIHGATEKRVHGELGLFGNLTGEATQAGRPGCEGHLPGSERSFAPDGRLARGGLRLRVGRAMARG